MSDGVRFSPTLNQAFAMLSHESLGRQRRPLTTYWIHLPLLKSSSRCYSKIKIGLYFMYLWLVANSTLASYYTNKHHPNSGGIIHIISGNLIASVPVCRHSTRDWQKHCLTFAMWSLREVFSSPCLKQQSHYLVPGCVLVVIQNTLGETHISWEYCTGRKRKDRDTCDLYSLWCY